MTKKPPKEAPQRGPKDPKSPPNFIEVCGRAPVGRFAEEPCGLQHLPRRRSLHVLQAGFCGHFRSVNCTESYFSLLKSVTHLVQPLVIKRHLPAGRDRWRPMSALHLGNPPWVSKVLVSRNIWMVPT